MKFATSVPAGATRVAPTFWGVVVCVLQYDYYRMIQHQGSRPMDAWKQYLFRYNSEENIRDWARRLHLFRYCRAYGGMHNDGDGLRADFQYRSTNEMLEFLKFVEIKPVHHAEMPPQPVLGRSYSFEAFNKFPSLIKGTSWIEQPGHCQIAGQKVSVLCRENRIQISIFETNWGVSEASVMRAEIVEKLLKDAPLPRIEPPQDDKYCVCPKYYPEYFR